MKRLLLGTLAWAAAFAAVAQEPADLDTIRRMATEGSRVQAMQELDSLIAAEPDNIQALFLKGLMLHDQGETMRSREVFTEIARMYPRLPEAYNNLAVIYAAEGELEKARGALLSAISNAPEYADGRANLGDLYVKMAADAYRKAVELDPADEASEAKLKALEGLFEEES